MTSSSSLAITAATSASGRPKTGDIVLGKVVAVIKDKGKKDAIPHAVILAFGSTSGMLRGRDLNGDAEAQRVVMKSVRRGDEFTVMVSDCKGTLLEPKYDLSESRATDLLAAQALVGQTVEGHVLNTAKYGAFIDLGSNRSGLLHVSEMGSNNQERRRSQLNKGMPVTVNVLAVEPDPTNPAKFRFELSEVEAELKKAAELVGKKITATIAGPCNAGLKLVLKSGVEATLAYENFGSLKVEGLKVGGTLHVKVLGIVGRALSVTFK
ncbi:MAG: S1 RNA-binding domain-containing protein [Candidatus Obscuribacterales bacterium]|nr:S1 RNA-binding domain-containing protein [Candidatus Obscuribacterales bacterium]